MIKIMALILLSFLVVSFPLAALAGVADVIGWWAKGQWRSKGCWRGK